MANTVPIDALVTILSELVDGAPPRAAYVLNGGDPGLLQSLDKLSAKEASLIVQNGSSIAAHADHLCYGLSLMVRWSQGEQPFADADWTESWKRTHVSDQEWKERRRRLADLAHAWREGMKQPRELQAMEQNGIAGSVVHLAYHFGAIRQMNRAMRGPSATEAEEAALDPQQLG